MDIFDLAKKDDKNLVVEYLAGDEDVLSYLIDRHLKSVYLFVFGLVSDAVVAEDITQDVFVKVWKKLKSYDDKYSFKTWLFSIARNTVIDYYRKKKEVVFSEFENEAGDNVLIDTLADEAPLADEALAKIQDISAFNEILKKLPPLYKEVLLLRYAEDLSIEEIARVLKRPVETVKSQHRRGVLHLRALLMRIK